MKKLAVKFEGNEILSTDNYDMFACYRDLWKTDSEKRNAILQGIISTDCDITPNCMKLRINAGDKSAGVSQDKAIADAYGNKFIIPLDFEMLDSVMPYYQAGLRNRLSYELKFNDYNRVIKYFAEGKLANETQKNLQLYDLSVGEYLTDKYGLWLDFRTIDENELHKMGRNIGDTSGGITIQIKKKAETAGALNANIYLIMDAQLNIKDGIYVSAVY